MAYGFWDFWIYMIINFVVMGYIGIYTIWFMYFDTRLRIYSFYPHKQVKIFRQKIINETIDIKDENNKQKTYTVNRGFIYYRGRVPYAFYWDNVPIPINMEENKKIKLNENELKKLKSLLKKANLPTQLDINKPSIRFKNNITIDTAETFFRILHTNLTLNLLKPPKDFKEAIKYTAIFVGIGIFLAVVLHFVGVIDIFEILGTSPP